MITDNRVQWIKSHPMASMAIMGMIVLGIALMLTLLLPDSALCLLPIIGASLVWTGLCLLFAFVNWTLS